jgi:hypothetical protein
LLDPESLPDLLSVAGDMPMGSGIAFHRNSLISSSLELQGPWKVIRSEIEPHHPETADVPSEGFLSITIRENKRFRGILNVLLHG